MAAGIDMIIVEKSSLMNLQCMKNTSTPTHLQSEVGPISVGTVPADLAIASPSKDRLPTMYGSGPFCHSCQTNQMLIVNLLSNYLPPQEVRATSIMIYHIF